MNEQQIKEKILQFIKEKFYIDDPDKITDELELVQLGLGSIDFFTMIEFIKAEFAIKVWDTEITFDNFGSLGKICNYISGKIANG